ncbi:MAG: hypothetical protein GY856_40725 [bacterium]|nr:hypothetical protein [bacterium]
MTNDEANQEVAKKANRSRIPYVLAILVLGACLGASLFYTNMRLTKLDQGIKRLASELEIGKDNLNSLDYSTRDWSDEFSEQINDLDARLSGDLTARLRELNNTLGTRMDSLGGGIGENHEQISRQVQRLAETTARIEELLGGIGNLREKDTELAARLENQGRYLMDHTARLESHGRSLADHTAELENHDQALDFHETGLATVENSLAGHTGRVERAEEVLDSLRFQIVELGELLGNVNERMSEVKGRLSKIEGTNGRKDRMLRELDDSVYRLGGDIRKLESRVERLSRRSEREFGP